MGRPKGSKNKATVEFKQFWNHFLDSPEYVESLQHRILNGEAPHMERYIAELCKGKPQAELTLKGDPMAPLVIDAFRSQDAERPDLD